MEEWVEDMITTVSEVLQSEAESAQTGWMLALNTREKVAVVVNVDVHGRGHTGCVARDRPWCEDCGR